MVVEFDKSFSKSLDKIPVNILSRQIEKVIDQLTNASKISDIVNCKKLTGFKNYYRIRLGDYRIGFEKVSEKKIRLIIVAHRKDVYRIFP